MSLRRNHELRISVGISYKGKDGKKVSYPITKKVTTIGKMADQDIQLADPYVSRHHAEIIVKGEKVWIADKGSANGIFLISAGEQPKKEPDETPRLLRWNNAFLVRDKEQLTDGCTILLGNTELRVSIDEGNGRP